MFFLTIAAFSDQHSTEDGVPDHVVPAQGGQRAVPGRAQRAADAGEGKLGRREQLINTGHFEGVFLVGESLNLGRKTIKFLIVLFFIDRDFLAGKTIKFLIFIFYKFFDKIT